MFTRFFIVSYIITLVFGAALPAQAIGIFLNLVPGLGFMYGALSAKRDKDVSRGYNAYNGIGAPVYGQGYIQYQAVPYYNMVPAYYVPYWNGCR